MTCWPEFDEFSRVEDDDRAANRSNPNRDRGNDMREENGGKKNKSDDKEGDKKPCSDAFKGVNMIFNKPIHKIMFEIKDKQFFKRPKPIGNDPSKRDETICCLYHKDHGHRTQNCKNQFIDQTLKITLRRKEYYIDMKRKVQERGFVAQLQKEKRRHIGLIPKHYHYHDRHQLCQRDLLQQHCQSLLPFLQPIMYAREASGPAPSSHTRL